MKKSKKEKSFVDTYHSELIIILLLFVMAWIIVAPYMFIGEDNEAFKNSGVVGDTIGGITAPAIGILSAILIYFSFRAQIKANAQVNDQIKKAHQDTNFEFAINECDKLRALLFPTNSVNPEKFFPVLLEIQAISTFFETEGLEFGLAQNDLTTDVDMNKMIGKLYSVNSHFLQYMLFADTMKDLDLDNKHRLIIFKKFQAMYFEAIQHQVFWINKINYGKFREIKNAKLKGFIEDLEKLDNKKFAVEIFQRMVEKTVKEATVQVEKDKGTK